MNGNENDPEIKDPQDLKGCLLGVAGIMGFGLLLALVSMNFHDEMMAVLGFLFVAGVLYALVKHTQTTMQLVVFLIFFAVVGSIFDSCSKHDRQYEEPGVGFR